MLTVAIDGHPLPAVTVERRGRILLPLRMTFAALGATVRYDPNGRVVVAQTRDRTVRLRIGSSGAFVNGKYVALDVPAQTIASSTFVPLRFAAQALGASVGYDSQAELVLINTNTGKIRRQTERVKITAQIPAPDSKVATAYPSVTATITGASATHSDVVLTLDGRDVTALASFDGNTITFLPRAAMTPGAHTVTFSGKTLDGDTFSSQWSFTTAGTPPSDQSSTPANYGYQFFLNGPSSFRNGDWMHFTLLAPPGGSAYLQLCNLGYQYALWNGGDSDTYVADAPAPYGYWLTSCPVQAVYTSWNGQQYIVPLPIYVAIYTIPQPYPFIAGPTPSPAPSGRIAPLPPDRRRNEPPPSKIPAKPAPKGALKPVQVSIPKMHAQPEPKPVYPQPKPVKPSPRAN